MSTQIHFEQLVEEVRASFPQSQTIWATEQPLQFTLDGMSHPVAPYLEAHKPFWMTVTPSQIPADGVTPSLLQIIHPARANLTVTIRLSQHDITWEEEIPLDASGIGELDIVAETPGEIRIDTQSALVRGSILATPI
jgi:hypothetical protein